MARQLIFFVIALAASALGAPSEEAGHIPENTQVSGQINVKAPLVSVPSTQLIVQDKQKSQEEQQDAEDTLVPIAPVLAQDLDASPDLLETPVSPDGDKSDLDTANTWGWGWRRRGYGWGGGYGGWGGWSGGYYRPYWGGHGWGRGWGHGYGYWG